MDKVLRVPKIIFAPGNLEKLDCCCVEYNNWESQYPVKPQVNFRIAHDDAYIYVDFIVDHSRIRAVNSDNQSPVSQDSCVEFFIEPHKDGEYWNFEFNCIGAVNASHRFLRPNPTRLTDSEIEKIYRKSSLPKETFEEKNADEPWNLLIGIPFQLLGMDKLSPGTRIRANLYACASAMEKPYYLSWQPVKTEKPDFHRPEFFGILELE